ncbi:MAG: segregation and condensation protein A [Anaerolineales bacterium]
MAQVTHTTYEVHTALFDGPLDLLLHLIEEEELDITQVALAKVTDQFLEYVKGLQGDPEMELVADFLVVAARLLWIKSRALLPRPSATEPAGDEGDEVTDELITQLRRYRRYKEAAQSLRERDEAGLHAYVRVARPPRPQKIILDLSDVTLSALQALAQAALYPLEGPRPEEAIQRPRISIGQQIRLIQKRLTHWKNIAFHTLLGTRPTRLEAIVTLQALLELIKQEAVQAVQGQRFGEIIIEALAPPEQIRVGVPGTDPPSPPPHQ